MLITCDGPSFVEDAGDTEPFDRADLAPPTERSPLLFERCREHETCEVCIGLSRLIRP